MLGLRALKYPDWAEPGVIGFFLNMIIVNFNILANLNINAMLPGSE